MTTEYVMRAFKITSPDGYVYWSVLNSPDNSGTFSGYNPADLINIAVDYTLVTQVIGSGQQPTSGIAGGDLTGTYPNPTVRKINGTFVAPEHDGYDGYVLTITSDGYSQWILPTSGGFIPGGDLSGNSTSQTVVAIQGYTVSSDTPESGQVYAWDIPGYGANFKPTHTALLNSTHSLDLSGQPNPYPYGSPGNIGANAIQIENTISEAYELNFDPVPQALGESGSGQLFTLINLSTQVITLSMNGGEFSNIFTVNPGNTKSFFLTTNEIFLADSFPPNHVIYYPGDYNDFSTFAADVAASPRPTKVVVTDNFTVPEGIWDLGSGQGLTFDGEANTPLISFESAVEARFAEGSMPWHFRNISIITGEFPPFTATNLHDTIYVNFESNIRRTILGSDVDNSGPSAYLRSNGSALLDSDGSDCKFVVRLLGNMRIGVGGTALVIPATSPVSEVHLYDSASVGIGYLDSSVEIHSFSSAAQFAVEQIGGDAIVYLHNQARMSGNTSHRPLAARTDPGCQFWDSTLLKLYVSDGSVWTEIDSSGSAAGGDLSGTYPNPSVAKLQGISVASTGIGASQDGYVLTYIHSSTQWQPKISKGINGVISATFDGQGSVITASSEVKISIPYAGTITGWRIMSGNATSGSAVVDVWKIGYASEPPTVTNTITGSDLPTLSSAIKNQNQPPTGWTTSFSAQDVFIFHVNSATSITKLIVELFTTRS